MEQFEIVVDDHDAGKRLDVFLVEKFDHKYSRTFIKNIIGDKNAIVNGKHGSAHYHVQSGDEIKLNIDAPSVFRAEPENIKLDIVYEDKDVVVVNKPAGLVVHPAPGNYTGTLVNALLYHSKDLSGIGGVLRPGIVHRLDKDTSGLIVAAKSDLAHRSLQEQFKNREAGRTYIALVKGIVQLDNGIIDMPIGRHAVDRKRMDVNYFESREAVTKYKVLKRLKNFTILELKLDTGRTHQIRVHMKHLGHPIIGDPVYGVKKEISRQALHAQKLSFVHPVTGKRMEFECPVPDDMAELMKRSEI